MRCCSSVFFADFQVISRKLGKMIFFIKLGNSRSLLQSKQLPPTCLTLTKIILTKSIEKSYTSLISILNGFTLQTKAEGRWIKDVYAPCLYICYILDGIHFDRKCKARSTNILTNVF